MGVPDTLGLNVNEARREIRLNCPNLPIVIRETHSWKEQAFMDIERAVVIRQTVTQMSVELLVAFFGDVYGDAQ